MIERREITKQYFDVLEVKRTKLFEQARTAESGMQVADLFDQIIRTHRLQLDLIPQIFNLGTIPSFSATDNALASKLSGSPK